MNELKINEETSVTFQANQIEFNNFEVLKEMIQEKSKKYANLVVSEETIKEAKKSRAELNKLNNSLTSRQTAVKRAYDEPFMEFKSKIKELKDEIKPVVTTIDDKVKELENFERQEKSFKVKELINEMAPNYGVDPETIEIENSWLNKSTSLKKITEQLKDYFIAMEQKRKRLESDINTIEKYATANDVEPYGWVDQIKRGQNVDDVLLAIDNVVRDRRIQQSKREAMQKKAAEHQTTVGDKIVDTNSGEIVSRKVLLEVTVTDEQTVILGKFMNNHGIKYRKVD